MTSVIAKQAVAVPLRIDGNTRFREVHSIEVRVAVTIHITPGETGTGVFRKGTGALARTMTKVDPQIFGTLHKRQFGSARWNVVLQFGFDGPGGILKIRVPGPFQFKCPPGQDGRAHKRQDK